MRLKPALILLGVFVLVIGALAWFVWHYEGPATDALLTFLEEKVFPDVLPADVQKIEITSPKAGGPIVIERAGTRKWHLTQPVQALARTEKIERLLAAFADLRSGRAYATRRLDEYGLERPRFRMTVTTGRGASHTVAFGARAAGIAGPGTERSVDPHDLSQAGGPGEVLRRRYARIGRRDQVLIVNDALCPQLDIGPADLREPRLVFAETEHELAPIQRETLRRAVVHVRDGPKTRTITLTSPDGKAWRLAAPVGARAHHPTVQMALARLLLLQAAPDGGYADDEPKDPAAYGLADPAVTVTVDAAGADGTPKRYTVRFGDTPKNQPDLIYAQSSARDDVLRVGGDLARKELTREVEHFRDPRVVAFGTADVHTAAFRYKGSATRLVLQRRPTAPHKWRLAEPVTGRADTERVNRMIDRLTHLEVEPKGGFVDEAPARLAPYGLDAPQLVAEVVLRGRERRKVTVLFGGSPPGRPKLVYARNAAERPVLLVSGGILDDLAPSPRSLRSRIVLEDYDSGTADQFEVVTRGRRIRLRRPNTQTNRWEAVEPKGLQVGYAAPSHFLSRFAGLRVTGWPEGPPEAFGLDKPDATVTIQTERRLMGTTPPRVVQRTYVLHLARKKTKPELCCVRLASESQVYEVDAAILDSIAQLHLALRDPRVLRFEPAHVTLLRVEGGRATYLGTRNRGWSFTQPTLADGDETHVQLLLQTLSQLRAKRLVREGGLPDPTYGFAKPRRKVVLGIFPPAPGGPEGAKPTVNRVTRTLLVGHPVEKTKEHGDHYAVVVKDQLVFEMAAEDVRKLDRELISPVVMNVVKEGASRLTLARRGRPRVALAKVGVAWQIEGRPDLEADQRKIETLVEETGWVKAKEFVAYDQDDLDRYGLKDPSLRLEITPRGQLPIELLVGAHCRGRLYYALSGKVQAVFLIDEEKVRALSKRAEDLGKARKP